ncbi:division/cell wall cluster transcriptional repressor MraZ [[Mycoplasma] falconis]|uniref:Transcriptional regulator MraZ n=1 Tax=[Mycoplasma] falconis TaxID=92403 RepID=A0A501X9E6_9BACT|nr:division/cell wall cluster transcriptional repressor MraZ [[Mycoplasma] falconis]TPE57152.1 division/cell wall cluster transcriptional repressor MraZ [[Mycoplasma] falconis]
MFGKYEHKLDDKNRLVVPAKILQELGSSFYVTIGLDKNLVLRSNEEFQKLTAKLQEGNYLSKENRAMSRYIFANTECLTPDKLGRVVISKHLLQKVAIEKEVVFVGNNLTCDIFAKDQYYKDEAELDHGDNVDELARKLLEQGVAL